MKHSKKLPIECANKYEWISDMKKLFENWRKHLNENNQAAVAVNQVIEKAQGNAYMMGSMEPDINELIASVTELIQGYTVARTLECTEEDLVHSVFPHPTLSEMMHESVLDAYGRAIHF